MFKNILIAYDEPNHSDVPFKYALGMQRQFGAKLDVVTVVRPLLIGDDVEMTAHIEKRNREARRAAQRLSDWGKGCNADIGFHTSVGDPALKIIDCAEKTGSDLIVMGCSGVSLLERLLTGSTVRLVMGISRCPILVVP
jgi:nucleotide-binding universal stress UspA family protein